MSPPAPPAPMELPGVPVQAGYKVLLVPKGYSAVLLPNDANLTELHHPNDPSNNYSPYQTDPGTDPSTLPELPVSQSMMYQLHDPIHRPKTPTHIPPPPAPSTPAKKIPRPHNSFMTYRSDKHKEVLEKNAGKSSKDVSKLIAEMWRNEPPEVQEFYKRKADEGRAEHKLKYPDYKYSPNKKKKHHQTDSTHQGGIQKNKAYSRSAPNSRSASRTASPMPHSPSIRGNRRSGRAQSSFNMLSHFNSVVNLGSEDTHMDNPDAEMTMSPVGSPSGGHPIPMYGSQSARASPAPSVGSSHWSLASSYYSVGSSHYSVASSHYSGHSRGRRSFRSDPTSVGTSVCDSPIQREEWNGGEWGGDRTLQDQQQQQWEDDLFFAPKSAPSGDYMMQQDWSDAHPQSHFVAEADVGFLENPYGGGQNPQPGMFESLPLSNFDTTATLPAFESHPFFQPPPQQHSAGVDPDELSRAIAALSGVEGLVNLEDEPDAEGSVDNEVPSTDPNNVTQEFESLGLGFGVDVGLSGSSNPPQRQQPVFVDNGEVLDFQQQQQQQQQYFSQNPQYYPHQQQQQEFPTHPMNVQNPHPPPPPVSRRWQQQHPLPQQGGPGRQLLTLADFEMLAKSLENMGNDRGDG